MQSARHLLLYRLVQFLKDCGLRLGAIHVLFGDQGPKKRRDALEREQDTDRQQVVADIAECVRQGRAWKPYLTEPALRARLHQAWRKRFDAWDDISDHGERLLSLREQAWHRATDALFNSDLEGPSEADIVRHILDRVMPRTLLDPEGEKTKPLRAFAPVAKRWVGYDRLRREELWRRCRWAARQLYVPEARLSGERVQDSTMHHGTDRPPRNRVPRSAPEPTDRDFHHFTMVSVLVRQEGVTQAAAIQAFARRYGNDARVIARVEQEIVQSLDRVSQYHRAIASQAGREPLDWAKYWEPGVLQKRLHALMN